MSELSKEEMKEIYEEVDQLETQVKTSIIASSRNDAIEDLLVEKGVLTRDEIEQEVFKAMKKLKDSL